MAARPAHQLVDWINSSCVFSSDRTSNHESSPRHFDSSGTVTPGRLALATHRRSFGFMQSGASVTSCLGDRISLAILDTRCDDRSVRDSATA